MIRCLRLNFARRRLRRLAGAMLAGTVAALAPGDLGRMHAQTAPPQDLSRPRAPAPDSAPVPPSSDRRLDPTCVPEKDVPRIEEVISAWCAGVMKGDRGKAYFDAGMTLISLHRKADAFRMIERAAELGDEQGLIDVGFWTFQGIGTPRDLQRGIALIETAIERGANATWLLVAIYEGEEFPYAAHLRDPMKATIWEFIGLGTASYSPAWAYGKKMGLTNDEVQEAARRAAKWVVENPPPLKRR